ncbi:uncharacterized protein LOC117643481 [Thrips palmi]|uniref:Uncharacterized protein LOC117643481 n=1 Tax=Thrips palmi TaxID=161013 RepID=A0A6P8YVY1_THRPL|nr:uncharacterized protein LOC117643481 [Thrips palmi]
MPLIRVAAADKSTFKFVVAETLSQSIDAAISKLGLLRGSDFKVCLEDGCDAGAEIDCEEIFQELLTDAAAKGKRLSICVLPATDVWRSPGSSSSGSDSTSSGSENSDSGSSGLSGSSGSISPMVPLPMQEINLVMEPVMSELEKPPSEQSPTIQKLKYDAIRATCKIVASHILLRVKDYQRSVAVHYAKSVFFYKNKLYKKVLEQTINNIPCGDGLDDFTLKIYNAVTYGKPSECKKRRGKRVRVVESDNEEAEDDPMPLPSGNRNGYDYGCVAYNPPLSESENFETQEEKRKLLISLNIGDAEVKDLFSETYPSQRAEIVACKPFHKLIDFFPRWPLFLEGVYLINHAGILLGKDLLDIWSRQLSERAGPMTKYFEALSLSDKNLSQVAKARRGAKMCALLADVDKACNNSRSQFFVSIGIFPLLAEYFHEKFGLMTQIVPTGSTDDDVLLASKCSNGNPIIIVEGRSLFDESVNVFLIINNKIVIKCVDYASAVLALFVSFYVFGFCYTKEIQCVLEFIQRFLLDINPEKGNKRKGGKRYVGDVCPKVVRLSEELRTFSSPWTLDI